MGSPFSLPTLTPDLTNRAARENEKNDPREQNNNDENILLKNFCFSLESEKKEKKNSNRGKKTFVLLLLKKMNSLFDLKINIITLFKTVPLISQMWFYNNYSTC